MQSRLLIINCPSDYFVHVPMGTFGLCDYLSQKDFQVRLLNLALYDKSDVDKVLDHYLDLFRPTHVGLIFHWQETVEGVLWVGEYIKSSMDQIKVFCGGFTAGYFGENLLERCLFVDYLVKGDPEKPLELLLEGTEPSEIPNLIYRDFSGIRSNEVSYFIDQETISRISFCTLPHLYDHEVYIKAVEGKLGFPIFIGRGCAFNCRYCGGSRESFRLHSGRGKPVARSIDAVIADLKRLKEFTKKIYICYENDQGYIKALFNAMKKEESLLKTFQLNYGAWQLFDREFLKLYKDLFIFAGRDKPLFEVSPEVFDDKSRQKIKYHNLNYSIADVKENLYLINKHLGDSVKVHLFFSRYHDTAKTYPAMREEIVGIFRLKHDLFCENITNVRIQYDHLSTDVGSRYWEDYVEHAGDLDTLISATRKLKVREHYSFSVDNLCVYMPKTLSEQEILRCELLILILKTLENHFHELFHILFKYLGELFIGLIEEIVTEVYLNKPGNVFTALDNCELLNYVKLKVVQQESLLSKLPFIEDLARFEIRKVMCRRGPRPARSGYQTKRPRLNHAFISVHQHDYLDLPNFLQSLEKQGPTNLAPEKTVFIFLADDILSMTYETYRATLKAFEKGISQDEYYALMNKKGIFDTSYHKAFVGRLFQSDVLF
jgi:hypothetical protein